ncbi:hypothetical protein E5345_07410 [Propionibacterium sp. NM47_B9-13]|nr:hypothetical protein CP877_10530 [Cutibacterium modestum]TGY28705.1 hypothetical protein E5345_07410 [Propionibacterium sp. NM47_B9-13]
MMTRLGGSVKVSFSLQLMTVRPAVEVEGRSVDDPAQAAMVNRHRPVSVAAVARAPGRWMSDGDIVFSFIVGVD